MGISYRAEYTFGKIRLLNMLIHSNVILIPSCLGRSILNQMRIEEGRNSLTGRILRAFEISAYCIFSLKNGSQINMISDKASHSLIVGGSGVMISQSFRYV